MDSCILCMHSGREDQRNHCLAGTRCTVGTFRIIIICYVNGEDNKSKFASVCVYSYARMWPSFIIKYISNVLLYMER